MKNLLCGESIIEGMNIEFNVFGILGDQFQIDAFLFQKIFGNATTETKPFDAWKQAWNTILRFFPEPVEEERKKSLFFSPFKEFITLFWLLQEILKFCATFERVAILGKYFFPSNIQNFVGFRLFYIFKKILDIWETNYCICCSKFRNRNLVFHTSQNLWFCKIQMKKRL